MSGSLHTCGGLSSQLRGLQLGSFVLLGVLASDVCECTVGARMHGQINHNKEWSQTLSHVCDQPKSAQVPSVGTPKQRLAGQQAQNSFD